MASHLPHRGQVNPGLEQVASPVRVVKVLEGQRGCIYPEMSWEPKLGFQALASIYGR